MIRLFVALLLLSSAASAIAASVDQEFESLYQAEWQWRSAEFGYGDEPGRLDDVDARHQAAHLAYWENVLDQLDGIDTEALSRANQVNYAVYRAQIENLAADLRFKSWQMPFNSDSAFWSSLRYELGGGSLEDADDYRGYIDRMKQVPAYFDQQIGNMRAGLARGFSVPRAVLDGRDASIAAVAELDDPTQSVFYQPFEKLPDILDENTAEALRESAQNVIREQVVPAYAKLLRFFRDEYVPKARTTLAAEKLPNGEAFYRQQIRKYTTLDLGPEAIHQIGLEQVEKLHQQMVKTMGETGFDGSMAEFLAYLRTEPKFYAKSGRELLARSAWVAKRVDGEIGRLFGHLPRARFTIKPVPDAIAPYYTSGRGGPDTYLVNTYALPSRPLYNVPALTLHEAYPGHALQLQLAAERKGLPDFRTESYISAFGEGWGLYSEFLGVEMGIYETPYQRFGYLGYQMWRACRLVVDTGIHHYGWSRAKAIDYMMARTPLSRLEIENEVDRYISWPGQALSYELGYLKIRELRDRATRELGDKFDLRNFHDTILATGSVPLPVLEQRIERFIAEGGRAPERPCACAENGTQDGTQDGAHGDVD